jgi:hypothetical protein
MRLLGAFAAPGDNTRQCLGLEVLIVAPNLHAPILLLLSKVSTYYRQMLSLQFHAQALLRSGTICTTPLC